MNKKEKRKFIEPKMEFNPGLQKYEVVLPLRKNNKKLRIKVYWKAIIIGIIILVILIGLILLALKNKLI